ncbi:hypothetical protein COEREDRAFT_85052 [Coemansia reversa NRRL 1564]|uniref:R3H domain-containing protein n=1 Tax=Coemansia reversa (strain ATCC 12441 / NRRL 1564) TaxID=763665 RepID=A0A2G5BHT8_COERN|nr:hypothetical protein COEREDRAFT_85052 [Coemansia reversa NRRL 1564]|eukprot:PIA18573.1 hypothetical protein COEREDRAFT_85052 [Coemansia reversa NRRL 1564]
MTSNSETLSTYNNISTTLRLDSGVASIVDPILANALGSNESDRHFVLDSEQLVWDFLEHSQQRKLLLPKQNSYRRLLLHKLADYYNLTHVVVGKQRDEVVFYKRTPIDILAENIPEPLGKKVPFEIDHNNIDNTTAGFTHILLKKPRNTESSSMDDAEINIQNVMLQNTVAVRCLRETVGKGKSIEERQAEYERARAEIFQDNSTTDIER